MADMSSLGPDMSGFGGYIQYSSHICPAYLEISFSTLILELRAQKWMKFGHKGHLNTNNKFPMRFFPKSKDFLSDFG
jgi:hypothetical protein